MTDDFDFSSGLPSDEMASYLQMFLDETSEQLDALVETLLRLEGAPSDQGELNEAFRLIHSIKGSSAMMGFDSITVLTHHLENHFERIRSGLQSLDQSMMDLVLRCIDFLRECNHRLRAGQSLASAPDLLEELARHVATPTAARSAGAPAAPVAPEVPPVVAAVVEEFDESCVAPPEQPEQTEVTLPADEPPRSFHWRITVRFEVGLPLADLKAELIVARLSDLGELRGTNPPRADLAAVTELRGLQVLITSDRPASEIRSAAEVGGVTQVDLDRGLTEFAFDPSLLVVDEAAMSPAPIQAPAVQAAPSSTVESAVSKVDRLVQVIADAPAGETAKTSDSKSRMGETVRVDIDRLDNLLNLAGELVVTKARFVQISRQMSPALKKPVRARAIGESLRQLVDVLKTPQNNGKSAEPVGWKQQLLELESEIDAVEAQARLWEEGRRCFSQISDAVNQLTRVCDGLQRGVLDTRMVPVGPLFNRFKRVVRDISHELGKKVTLEIHGEKTELDKRMIDELGDPLVHLVRNAIDHGLESSDVRVKRGKPETGTLVLEAVHSGNNVYIHVRDDGGGINAAKIRQRIVDRGLVTADVASQLTDAEVIEFIWHPGFSTADVVSDISGRGVGMDIVKTRIAELNGTISVDTALGRGTTISVRLPLTLAIIRCLLFRVRHGMFAVPIDGVREIVSIPVNEIVTVHGRHTCEVRGEFIPLVDIDDVFDWPGSGGAADDRRSFREAKSVKVVILVATNETIGLRVDDLQGGQDIVIKSLVENFVHIRGLSGASILGDGSVCLLLDVAAAIDLAIRGRSAAPTIEFVGTGG